MIKFKVGEKKLKIKFGYKVTLKERIISRIVKLTESNGGSDIENMEKTEDLLLFLPEIILVGLQVYHRDEYGYDYDTKEGKEQQLNKVFDLVDEYALDENADLMQLFNELQEEMKNDSFLASLFRKEEKAEATEETVQTKIVEMPQTAESSEN